MTASEMAKKRWQGISPEQRAAHMKAIASRPRPKAKGSKKPRHKPCLAHNVINCRIGTCQTAE